MIQINILKIVGKFMSGIDKFQFMQLQDKYDELGKAHIGLIEQNLKMRECLEFYGDVESWNMRHYRVGDVKDSDAKSIVNSDLYLSEKANRLFGGKRSRKLLEELKGERDE